MNKIKTSFEKVMWALFNYAPPRALRYEKPDRVDKGCPSVLVITIDYDKFSHRTVKTVGATQYACGRQGLDHVLTYARTASLDYIEVTTTDSKDAARTYDSDVNKSITLRNGGSDIAALEALRTVIGRYDYLIVVNSSANVEDAHGIALVHNELIQCTDRHFVIGRNGNSRMSPRLPTAPSVTPHIITNLFACPARDVLDTLTYARTLPLYPIAGGFSNKFFAIRYFEIYLSRNAIFNGGVLVLLKGGSATYYRRRFDPWPKADSRLQR